jgi:hypothetical protein
MHRNSVTTRTFKIGKNKFLVIKITQRAAAITRQGNALATNQANVQIQKKKKKKH